MCPLFCFLKTQWSTFLHWHTQKIIVCHIIVLNIYVHQNALHVTAELSECASFRHISIKEQSWNCSVPTHMQPGSAGSSDQWGGGGSQSINSFPVFSLNGWSWNTIWTSMAGYLALEYWVTSCSCGVNLCWYSLLPSSVPPSFSPHCPLLQRASVWCLHMSLGPRL